MTELQKLAEVLRDLEVRYDCSDDMLRISLASICEHFSGKEGTEPDDLHGSCNECKAYLEEQLNAKINWSRYDDDWKVVDSVKIKED